MRGFIGSLRTRLGRIAGIVVSLLVIAGFAFVLLQMATGGPIAHTIVGDDPTPTVPLIQYETPTPTPLDAPPTPTFFAPGNATATPLPRNIPFSVDWPTRGVDTVQCWACNSPSETMTGPVYCLPQMQIEAQTGLHVTDGAPGGTATYRWITDLGPATPVLSIKLLPGDGYNGSNFIDTTWTISAALGDGTNHWAQPEVLTPNHLLGQRTWFNMNCAFGLYDQGHASVSSNIFDCNGPDTQTFTFTGSIGVQPGPAGHSTTFHWARYDGSVSPTYTAAVPAGATEVTLGQDTLTLTRSLPDKASAYWDSLVIDSPTPPYPPYQYVIFKNCG